MYRVQESAEQALGEVEQSYKRAVNSAKEVKDQVVREASDAHQAAQELVANAKRAADVRESVQSNTEAAISAVEKALGIEPHSAEKTEPGKEGGTRGSP
jgi:phosphoribosylcarboxyaminoimidazole (NCAIR) mutase